MASPKTGLNPSMSRVSRRRTPMDLTWSNRRSPNPPANSTLGLLLLPHHQLMSHTKSRMKRNPPLRAITDSLPLSLHHNTKGLSLPPEITGRQGLPARHQSSNHLGLTTKGLRHPDRKYLKSQSQLTLGQPKPQILISPWNLRSAMFSHQAHLPLPLHLPPMSLSLPNQHTVALKSPK